MKIDPNASAFPISPDIIGPGGDISRSVDFGLTKREEFAKAALTGMLCQGFIPDQAHSGGGPYDYGEMAVTMADALIAALNKTP